MGTIVLSIFMCFSGLFFAFFKGWKFSLVLLALLPVITLGTFLFTKVQQTGAAKNMKAYAQSAGYANQALNAIKVVCAFGQEHKEIEIFKKFLGRARTAGI